MKAVSFYSWELNKKAVCAAAMLLFLLTVSRHAMGQDICLDKTYPSDDRNDTICYGVSTGAGNDLLGQLTDRHRLNPEFKIVQGAMDRNGVVHAHKQWGGACHLFSHQAVVEYLGYARKEIDAHMMEGVDDFIQSPSWGTALDKDVGYWGSPEHLTVSSLNSPESPAGTRDNHGTSFNAYWDNAVDRNKTYSCEAGTWWPDNSVPEYAECNQVSTNRYWYGFRWGNNGYGRNWINFINNSAMWGCNDALYIRDRDFLPAEDNLDYLRAMVKAFIDNNIPLPMYVGETHWVTLMGYADIADDGLPATFFASDPAQYYGDEQGYREYHNLDFLGDGSGWGGVSSDGDRNLITKIVPWNQHINGGCKSGGWAKKFDDEWASTSPDFTLCSEHSNVDCNEGEVNGIHPRQYGVAIECWNDGSVVETFHATKENPFVVMDRNVYCDDVLVRYSDGRTDRQVTRGILRRYGYNDSTGEWVILSAYSATESNGNLDVVSEDGRAGNLLNLMDFVNWQTNYRMVGDGYSGTYSKRRTTLIMEFDNDDEMTVEIVPPNIYGITVTCENDGNETQYFLEADKDVTWTFDAATGYKDEWQFDVSSQNRVCDNVRMEIALGAGAERLAPSVTVTRFGFHAVNRRWQKLNASAPWSPDAVSTVDTGLSGDEHIIEWNGTWPSDYRFVGNNISGTYPERKTVFDITFATSDNGPGGTSQTIRRSLQIVPF
jgi:hypothetical protein